MRGRRGLAGAWLCALTLAPVAGCGLDTSSGTAVRGPASAAASTESAEPEEETRASYDVTPEDEVAIRTLMSARATAVTAGDRAAFLATVDAGQPKLLRSQKVLFDNLRRLPLDSLRYEVSTVYLTPAKVPGDDPLLHPQALEHVQITGTMPRPVSNALDVTFVKRDGAWLLAAERLPGVKGSVESPQERPWFGEPIAVFHEGELTVVVDAERRDQLDALVDTVRAGIDRDAEILGVPADERLLVDATSNGEAADFGAGVEEEVGAVTFAIASTDLEGRPTDLAGTAIKVNPEQVGELIDDSRLLWHELTHFLLFEHTPTSPRWLTEGVAAWVEYQPTELSGLVVPDELYDELQRPPRELPTEGVFYDDPPVSYLLGQAAVQWLVEQDGTDRLLELLKAFDRLGRTSDPDEATPRALREVYDLGLGQLTEATYDTVAELNH